MYYKFNITNISKNRHYIAVFSFYENEKIIIEPYPIFVNSYEEAINEVRIVKDMRHEFNLECLIELDIIPNKENIIFDLGIGEEKGDKGEPGVESVNSMTYWNGAKKKDEFKFCPFRFDNNGGMRRCVGHTCMAYMIDSDDCSHYCARLQKGK